MQKKIDEIFEEETKIPLEYFKKVAISEGYDATFMGVKLKFNSFELNIGKIGISWKVISIITFCTSLTVIVKFFL